MGAAEGGGGGEVCGGGEEGGYCSLGGDWGSEVGGEGVDFVVEGVGCRGGGRAGEDVG